MFSSDDLGPGTPGFDEFEPVFNEPDTKKLEYAFMLSEVEELLPLSRRLQYVPMETALYHFEGKYYLHVSFDEILHSDEDIKDHLSVFSEYLPSSSVTIHRLEEYGKEIFDKDALSNILHYFG